MKQNETNKERKTLKERLSENKGKIMAGAIVVTVGAVSYILYKNSKQIKTLNKLIDKQINFNENMVELSKLQDEIMEHSSTQIAITKDIAKEGALEEGMASLKRKIQYRVGKISDLKARPEDKDAIISKEIYEKELEVLKAKLKIFEDEWDNMIH